MESLIFFFFFFLLELEVFFRLYRREVLCSQDHSIFATNFKWQIFISFNLNSLINKILKCNSPSKFHNFPFQSFNFSFCHFNPLSFNYSRFIPLLTISPMLQLTHSNDAVALYLICIIYLFLN